MVTGFGTSLGTLEIAVLRAAVRHRLILLPSKQIAVHADEHTVVQLFDEGESSISELCGRGLLKSRSDDLCAGPTFEITDQGLEILDAVDSGERP